MHGAVVIRILVTVVVFVLASLTTSPPASALICSIFGCSCSVAATTLDFHDINPLNGAQAAEGEITVDCTGLAELFPNMPVSLQSGIHGAIGTRKMRSAAGDLLDYNLYTTTQYNTIWGNGTTGLAAPVSGGFLAIGHWTATRRVYGVVTPTNSTKPGSYTDTVVLRIDW